MIFFASPLDRAADKYVKAQFKVNEAERKGRDSGEALAELRQAEENWRVVCDSLRRKPKRNLLAFLLEDRKRSV